MALIESLDWIALLKIVGVDIMLGVDNAIVIALACAALPAGLRTRAILFGTAGAVLLRALLLVFAGFLLGVPYIKIVAGGYLLYLGFKLLSSTGGDEPHVAAADRVIAAVKTIIVADFMMSLDNVLAVAGAAEGAGAHGTLYAIAGIFFSIPIIVFGATGLMKIMERFPVIVWMGGGLLGWVGAEMILTDQLLKSLSPVLISTLGEHANNALELLGFVLVIGAALIARGLQRKQGGHPIAKSDAI